MAVSWKRDTNPEQLISKIEEVRDFNDDGKVVFKGLGVNGTLLYGMLDFLPEVPEEEARRIVLRAIFKAGAKGAITTKKLLSEVNRLENNYRNLPIQRFVLVSSISIGQFTTLQRIRDNGNLLVFDSVHSKQYRKFQQQAHDLLKSGRNPLFSEPPTNYLGVRVFVSAKSIHDAVNMALDSIDYIRGIWNLAYNKRDYIRISSGGKPEPINKVILGPLHTLHYPSSKLAADNTWWYEPNYLGAISVLNPSDSDIEYMYNNLKCVRRRLKTSKYPDDIRDALIRYARVLDERNWGTAYLRLWSILEMLTNTTGESYKVTVRRASFLFEERDYYFQILQLLRKYRNDYVHFDQTNTEIETYLYQLKNFVEVLLDFHIKNRFHFKSIQEAAEFLDLPYDEVALSNKLENLKFVQKFRGYM